MHFSRLSRVEKEILFKLKWFLKIRAYLSHKICVYAPMEVENFVNRFFTLFFVQILANSKQ